MVLAMVRSAARTGDGNGISEALDRLVDLTRRRGRLFVLTGAGCSTASGIPDYRGPDGYRFCREAAALSIPIALVNRGKTRADDLAAIKVEGEAGSIPGELARRLA